MRSLEEQARERLAKLQRRRNPIAIGLLKFSLTSLLLASAIAGGVYLWQTTDLPDRARNIASKAKDTATEAGLKVAEVTIKGRVRTDKDAVMAALALQEGQSILDFNTEAARERLELVNWVLNARVTRILPDKIHVELIERTPVALWQHEEGHILIDEEGRLLQDHGLAEFSDLPVVVGMDAPDNVSELLEVIGSVPDLADRVTGAQFIGGRRWNVKLDTGLFVRLPAQDPLLAWSRFQDLVQEHDLLNREVIIVDLRQKDRTYVRLTPGAAERRRLLRSASATDTKA